MRVQSALWTQQNAYQSLHPLETHSELSLFRVSFPIFKGSFDVKRITFDYIVTLGTPFARMSVGAAKEEKTGRREPKSPWIISHPKATGA
jgi:hypothetical protein